MIYKSFEIRNFKGIERVIIDLTNNRIISLVGLNESGKTTIMEAINLFHDMIKGNEPPAEQLNLFRPKGIAFTGAIEIRGTLIFERDDKQKISLYWSKDLSKKGALEIPDEFNYAYQFNFILHAYKNTARTCGFTVKRAHNEKTLFNTDNDSWQKLITFVKNSIVPETLYYDDFTFEIPDKIFCVRSGFPQDKETTGSENERWQLVLSDILKSINPQMTFQEHVVDRWEDDKDAATNRLAQMERALNEKITRRWGDLFGKKKVNFREIKLESDYSNGKLSLAFKIRTHSKHEFLIKERSKGFRWFFSFFLFTEFRKTRTKNILFLLDEPASNLHPSAQGKLLDAFEELSADSLVIYSTHSHHLINPRWLAGAYVCINENLSTDVLTGNLDIKEGGRISATKYFTYVGHGLGSDKTSYFQPILDRLDYRPSTLEPTPDIVILEGKNDWYTLKYFEEHILQRQQALHLYPGAGRDKLYDIIRLYLAWGKNFLVLLDGDDGIKSKAKYIKEFGEWVSDKVFTLKDLFNQRITMEDLISPADQRKIRDEAFAANEQNKSQKSSPKANLNYAINQLLVQRKPIDLGQDSKERFTKVLDFLAEQLSRTK